MKALLSREGAAFTAKNVDEDDRASDELIALGFRVVPVTIIGDRIVTGYDEVAITSALAAQKDPSSG